MDKAVMLARGLGTRMQKDDPSAALDAAQAQAAKTGAKAMIPIAGGGTARPFLDYVLSALADAGYRRACLVVGPEHQEVRDYYARMRPKRIKVEYAIQANPLGTADAVAAAEQFAAGEPFLAVNSDNYYPVEALAGLRGLSGSGLAAFERDAMIQGGNIPAERIAKFAVVRIDADGYMTEVIEKPSAEVLRDLPRPVCVSMNCWRLGPAIFPACRSIPPSPRGELELPHAVQYSMEHLAERYRALTFRAPVLDLSCRSDVAPVAGKLRGVEVNL
jgi:glucose-1-phosphate thymidylyltransferase